MATIDDVRAKAWIAKRKKALALYEQGLSFTIIGYMIHSPKYSVMKMIKNDPPQYVITYLQRQGLLK